MRHERRRRSDGQAGHGSDCRLLLKKQVQGHVKQAVRINRAIAEATARLATDLPGSALVGRDSHPLDDKPNFMESSQDSLLSDQHCLVASTKRSTYPRP